MNLSPSPAKKTLIAKKYGYFYSGRDITVREFRETIIHYEEIQNINQEKALI